MKTFLLTQKEHKDLTELSFSNEESKQIEWEEETEFRYKGEMYDVIEKKTKEDCVVLRCITDRKETDLLQEYQKNTKRNNSNSFIAQLITAQFILPADYSLQEPQSAIKRNFINSSPSLLSSVSKVSSPPPDIC